MKRSRLAGGAAIGFGLLTVISGGSALFGDIDMGAVVPFVLWFNFLAGFAYVVAGGLLWRGNALAFPAALLIFVATVVVLLAFAGHVVMGGGFEMRTVGAITLRSVFWAAMVWVAARNRAI